MVEYQTCICEDTYLHVTRPTDTVMKTNHPILMIKYNKLNIISLPLIYCKPMVTGTNSRPTGIPTLRCGEEGNYSLRIAQL